MPVADIDATGTGPPAATPQAPQGVDHQHTPNPNAPLPPSPFRTAETFDHYCTSVQGRLISHARQRADFLQTAYDRLTRLMQTARDVEDSPLHYELGMHRVAVRELMDALGRTAPGTGPTPTPRPIDGPGGFQSDLAGGAFQRPTGPAQGLLPPRPKPALPEMRGPRNSPSTAPSPAPEGPGPAADRAPRRPMRPLADIEADAAQLRDDLKEWAIRHPLKSGESLNIPNCLRIRAFACRQRRLEEEAGDSEVTEVSELVDDIVDMLDAVNDQEYTVALDDELEPKPTAWQWGEMAERYEEMGRAQEAFEWWQKHKPMLTVPDVQPLAEAIAAVQQRFNRLLFRVGARDPFQQTLFDELRTWAREDQCYLYSLRPKVPMAELVERATTLEPAWEHAKQPLLEEEERQRAIDDVIHLVSQPAFGSEPERDERRLNSLIAECKALRIGSADTKLREALIPWAVFIEGDDRNRDILRDISAEWERRQDAGKTELASDAPEAEGSLDSLTDELAAVREVTRGKRVLILGGINREENGQQIQAALETEVVVWPGTRPNETLDKYEDDIRNADIVALVSRYSRKDWKRAQDICAQEGRKYVQLTSGHGVSQVVRQFYKQLTPQAAAKA